MNLTQHIRNVFTTGRRPGPRGFVAEWTLTLLLVFFGTTTLVQAYVIPTGSMEGNLLIGDHMLVVTAWLTPIRGFWVSAPCRTGAFSAATSSPFATRWTPRKPTSSESSGFPETTSTSRTGK